MRLSNLEKYCLQKNGYEGSARLRLLSLSLETHNALSGFNSFKRPGVFPAPLIPHGRGEALRESNVLPRTKRDGPGKVPPGIVPVFYWLIVAITLNFC